MTTQRKLVARALSIDELAYNLENISQDDKKAVEDYTDDEILAEARYVLDLFVNPGQGHINGEALRGEEGPDQKKWARSQVGKLQRFIAAYTKSPA